MIFYNAIKYKILDYCLESFFRGIIKNFSIFSKRIDPRELVNGSVIKTIYVNWGNKYDIIENAKVIDIVHSDDGTMKFRIFAIGKYGVGYTIGFENIPVSSVDFFI